MSLIVLDDRDKRPPYEQIQASIIRLIADGTLEPGTRLAPIRQLAGDLGVATNTVARAYRELERNGFVISRGRRGTTVTAADDLPAISHPAAELRHALDVASDSGLSHRSVLDIVSAHLAH